MNQASQLIASQYRNSELTKRLWSGVVYNVKEFGAKGDGVTDDSNSVFRAINAAKGTPVYFPTGTYNCVGMSPVNGKVILTSLGETSVIMGFSYNEQSMPPQDLTPNVDDAMLQAFGLTFMGVGDTPALHIVNQVNVGVARSFTLNSCVFRGKIGLVTENCITSKVINCDFIRNQYAYKSLSCTNIEVTDCHWFSPIIGIYLNAAAGETIRKGGENMKLSGCTMIDGVTGIQAYNNAFLWLINTTIDYFNCGLFMSGSMYCRMNQTYIAVNDADRSGVPNYIPPLAGNCVYAVGESTYGRPSGIECVNAEFVVYAQSNKVAVDLEGGTVPFTGIQEVKFIGCRFGTFTNSQYLLRIDKASSVMHMDNIYSAPSNDILKYPYYFTNIAPLNLFSERNDINYCFKSNGTKILPEKGYLGNEKFESGTITLTTNGTATTNANNYVFRHNYFATPRMVATVRRGFDGVQNEALNVSIDAYDANTVYLKVRHIDGTNLTAGNTILVDVFCCGE